MRELENLCEGGAERVFRERKERSCALRGKTGILNFIGAVPGSMRVAEVKRKSMEVRKQEPTGAGVRMSMDI